MRSKSLWMSALVLGVAAACGGGGSETPSTTPAQEQAAQAPAAVVDEATAGRVTGKVTLDGAAPKPDRIQMNADPVCVRQAKGEQVTEYFLVGDGSSLGNVFVYVKDGLSGSFPAPATAVTLDQQGCRYVPHVFGIQVGQPLEVVNSDPTLHNIHAMPKANSEFNTGQPIQGMKFNHTFQSPEVMVPFKCDVHGWMNAYVGVLNHPYFAVSGSDGAFSIDKLPPGTYTLEAWHEKLGTQTQSVTIGPKEAKEVTFTFKTT